MTDTQITDGQVPMTRQPDEPARQVKMLALQFLGETDDGFRFDIGMNDHNGWQIIDQQRGTITLEDHDASQRVAILMRREHSTYYLRAVASGAIASAWAHITDETAVPVKGKGTRNLVSSAVNLLLVQVGASEDPGGQLADGAADDMMPMTAKPSKRDRKRAAKAERKAEKRARKLEERANRPRKWYTLQTKDRTLALADGAEPRLLGADQQPAMFLASDARKMAKNWNADHAKGERVYPTFYMRAPK